MSTYLSIVSDASLPLGPLPNRWCPWQKSLHPSTSRHSLLVCSRPPPLLVSLSFTYSFVLFFNLSSDQALLSCSNAQFCPNTLFSQTLCSLSLKCGQTISKYSFFLNPTCSSLTFPSQSVTSISQSRLYIILSLAHETILSPCKYQPHFYYPTFLQSHNCLPPTHLVLLLISMHGHIKRLSLYLHPTIFDHFWGYSIDAYSFTTL